MESFAGAQNSNERRRRRLANDESNDSDLLLPAQPTADDRFCSPLTDSMFQRLISPRLWKSLCALCVLTALNALVIVYRRGDVSFGSGERIDVPSDLSHRLAGLQFLVAGLLALVTGWARSQSELDFRGRYRVWKWTSVYFLAIGTVMVLGLGSVVPQLLTSSIEALVGPVVAARPAILFACSAVVSAFVLGRVIPDMSRCRYSQGLMVVAVLMAVVKEMLVRTSHSSVNLATLDGLTLLAANAALASVLLHCRFVSWICNDPPEGILVDSTAETRETCVSEMAADFQPQCEAPPAKHPAKPRKNSGRKTQKKTSPSRGRKKKAA